MQPFMTHKGIAVPLLRDNIDTDQIIPSREMKRVSKEGLGEGLFAGQRYTLAGSRDIDPNFNLNKAEYEGASIILAGKNFGCGSSREHAVWALKDYGIRVIIAKSFGEIFYNNCITNGLLPIQLTGEEIASLPRNIYIDLVNQTVETIAFDIGAGNKRMLVEGLDPIALTLEHQSEIGGFLKADEKQRSWIY